jgi:hypothetical protein
MEPDHNWFKAPENHFWYWAPAEEDPPPYNEEDGANITQPATAPVPTTRDEVKKFIRVIIEEPGRKMFWEGDYLAEFPFFRTLSKDDLIAWEKWLEQPGTLEFLDKAISKCQIQAEANKDATGWAVIKEPVEADDGQIIGKKEIDNPFKTKQ